MENIQSNGLKITEEILREAETLRKRLHQIPEPSGKELKTRQLLKEYLGNFPFLKLHEEPGCLAAVRYGGEGLPSVVFRADLDAVSGGQGICYHGCGHDGHMSTVAVLASLCRDALPGKNLVFLFQSAEETGEGAVQCLDYLRKMKAEAIYGFHNFPGFPAGQILAFDGTIACASRGLVLEFEGMQSHAAYPENGRNPLYPAAKLLASLENECAEGGYDGMVLLTPIYLQGGEKAFGVAAGKAEAGLTIRAWKDASLEQLEENILRRAKEFSEAQGITVSFREQDVFPATVNSGSLYEKCLRAVRRAGLSLAMPGEPFRGSEDFGQFKAAAPIFMFGIGAGEKARGLHTPGYTWNPAVTESALKLFTSLLKDD